MKFPLPYWLIVAVYTLYSMGVCLFDNVSSEFFQERFGVDNETAGLIIAIPSFIVIILTPLFGFLIDRIGGKTIFSTPTLLILHSDNSIFLATSCIRIPCFLATFSWKHDGHLWNGANRHKHFHLFYCPLPLHGVNGAQTNFSYIIPKSQLGTAFGLFMALSNLALAVSPPFVGYIQDSSTRGDRFFWVFQRSFTSIGCDLLSSIAGSFVVGSSLAIY